MNKNIVTVIIGLLLLIGLLGVYASSIPSSLLVPDGVSVEKSTSVVQEVTVTKVTVTSVVIDFIASPVNPDDVMIGFTVHARIYTSDGGIIDKSFAIKENEMNQAFADTGGSFDDTFQAAMLAIQSYIGSAITSQQ